MTLAKIITKERKKLRHPLRRVASAIGISAAHLQDIERGHVQRPKMNALVGLADYYNLNCDELVLLGGRLPADVYYKIQRNPKLVSYIRSLDVSKI